MEKNDYKNLVPIGTSLNDLVCLALDEMVPDIRYVLMTSVGERWLVWRIADTRRSLMSGTFTHSYPIITPPHYPALEHITLRYLPAPFYPHKVEPTSRLISRYRTCTVACHANRFHRPHIEFPPLGLMCYFMERIVPAGLAWAELATSNSGDRCNVSYGAYFLWE